MKRRSATANWQGTGKEGKGNLSTESKALSQIPYTYKDRFEEGGGTNPEELIAAAHAGCYTMKLSFVLGAAGFTPDKLETKCEIDLDSGNITNSHLTVKATVPGISKSKFEECVEEAKNACPVSKLLKANITVESTLA